MREEKPFWDPEMETISDRDSTILEQKRLSRMIEYASRNTSFYKTKLRNHDGYQREIYTRGHLSKLPFTSKDELRTSQERSPPFGDYIATTIENVVRIHRTSGTTGKPLFLALTRKDIQNINECGARAFWASGLRPGIKIVHCMNYSMWMGGYTDHSTLERVGAAVVPFGVGQSKLLVRTIETLGIEALSATTSYPARLANVVREELGKEPKELGLKFAFLGGEIGLGIPGFRRSLEETWGLKAYDTNFGLADVMSTFAAECKFRNSLHFLGQGLVLLEIIDPETGEVREIQDNAEGEIVCTNLDKEAQPLIRYRTGDLIRVFTTEKCECGRTGFRFKMLGRTHDVLKVKGINVYVSAIQNIVSSFVPKLNGEFQIVLESPPPIHKLLVRVEGGVNGEDGGTELASMLQSKIKEIIGIEAKFEVLVPGALPRFEDKTQRVVRSYS